MQTVNGNPCVIAISCATIGATSHYDAYDAWRLNECYLDWYGAESNQGTYQNSSAAGTPTVWTTNSPNITGYQPDNV